MADELEFVLPVDEQEYEESTAGSWITFDPDAPAGTVVLRPVEIGVVDWDNVGVSLKFPVTITEGIDEGKQSKISAGVSKKAVFKIKRLYEAIGVTPQLKDGHPVVKPSDFEGKKAIGVWVITEGTKGGIVGAEPVKYPKLEELRAA